MVLSSYVRLVRVLRRLATKVGVLSLLDRHLDRRLVHWLRSQFSVFDVEDLAGLDCPWWSYAAIDEVEAWIRERDGRSLTAFEWGSGASTVWLASRLGSVRAVEHDRGFADTLRPLLPESVELRVVTPVPAGRSPVAPSQKRGFRHLDFGDYVAAIHDDDRRYDLIVVDGRARVDCLTAARRHLSDDGLIVFDNSDRARYQGALADPALTVENRRGLTPASPIPTRTSLVRLRP